MVFGISTACFFPDMFTEDAIDCLGQMGISNIEIFFSCMTEYRKPYIDEFKTRLNRTGIKVHSIHALSMQFEPQLFSPQKRARQEAEDIFRSVLEAGSELGAGIYVFHGPANLKRSRIMHFNYSYLAEVISGLTAMAVEYGIKLAWENVHWCWFAEPNFAKELLKQPGTECLYFTLDIKQAAQAGFGPEDYISILGERLINIHVCDYSINQEHGVFPVLPFLGNVDFYSIKDMLQRINYKGGMMLEVYRSNFRGFSELHENFLKVVDFFTK